MFEGCLADCKMSVVRRSYRYCLDAIGPLGFGRKHRQVVGIAAGVVEPQIDAEGAATLRIDVERAGRQLEDFVSECRRAMDIANLAAAPSSDHAPTDRIFAIC